MPIAPFIPAIISGAGALAQGLSSLGAKRKEKRAEADLERFAATDKPNESILDFYNKAYNRYNPNAYQSASYNAAMQNIKGNLATGLSSAQDRRSALAAIPSLVQGANRASMGAVSQAEAQQAQNLSQLGQAGQVKAREEQRVYGNKFNLLGQKAAQYAKRRNIQEQGALNSLGNAATLAYKGYAASQGVDS
jgi:hypothetical protein